MSYSSKIHRHQPDLIFNPDRRKTGFTFEADILNNTTADIMLHIEPDDPRGDMLAAWERAAANTPWVG